MMIKPILNLLQQRPVLAVFEVNLQCNSQCAYCDLPLNVGRYEMSREEISDIFSGLYQDGVRYIFVQGGEPTLRKDLIDIMQDLDRIGFNLTLITNGTRLNEDFLQRLSQLPVSISVSLDTLDRENYKQIRGADQLKLVLSGIERLKKYPHPKYITCIVSEKNREETLDVVKFARESGCIPVVGAYHWDIERYGKVDTELQYQKHTLAKVFEQVLASDLVPRGYFSNYLKDNIHWLNEGKLKPCDAGRYSIAIDPSGNVAPCLALEHAGNLRESRLAEILKNFDRAKINSCSNNSSCNMMCSRVVGSALSNPIAAWMTPDFV